MKKITPLINCLQKIYCVQTEMDHVPTGFQLLLKSARKLSPNSQLVIRIIKKLPNREFQQFQPGAYQESLWYACVCALSFIHVLPSGLVWIVCDPMDCRQQTPLSTGLFRQEYCSGLPCPPPGNLPDPGIEFASLCLWHWQAGSLPLSATQLGLSW